MSMPRRPTPGGHEAVPPYRPQLAKLVNRPPTGDDWVHEMKYDGYRVGCRIVDGQVRLISRMGEYWTDAFPEIVRAAQALAVRAALLDGEIAMLMPDGRTSLSGLQNALTGGPRAGLVFYAFDLLHVAGETLTGRPLLDRKRALLDLVGTAAARSKIRYSDHVVGQGAGMFEQACRLGLEGIVSKRADAPYKAGRGDAWLTTDCAVRQEVTRPPAKTAKRNVQPRPLVSGVPISHPDRVLYPEDGITKRRVAEYYERIADWIVPHVQGRPLTLVRCPEGIDGGCFYMKHSKVWAPPALRTVKIREKLKVGDYLIADTAAAVVSLVQMGVLEIHTWNTRHERIEMPDRIVFDLDPGEEIAWAEVVEAGRLVRRLLRQAGLESFPKTTGGGGLHVVVPLQPKADWSACLEFSRRLAELIHEHDPERYTTNFAKAGRERKILIDYLRNNRTNTSIAAYSTRARPGAPVSIPLRWDELKASVEPSHWTLEIVERRLATLRRDPWEAYWRTRQALPSPPPCSSLRPTKKGPSRSR